MLTFMFTITYNTTIFLKVDARVLAEAYREEVDAHQAALGRRAANLGLDLVTMVTDQGVDTALAAYLARRTAGASRSSGRSAGVAR